MKKKVLIIIMAALIVVLIVVIFLIQFNGDGNEGAIPEQNLAPEVVFSAFMDVDEDVMWGSGEISKKITEITGVALELVSGGEDTDEAALIMLASRNYPDLMLSINNNIVSAYAETGALVAMDDFIFNESQYIEETFSSDLDKMRFNVDGDIYGLNRQYMQERAKTNAIFNIQYEMLKEFGYPEIKTLDELYFYMLEYQKRYPQIDGRDTIGLSFYTQSYGFNVTLSNAALQAGGYQNDGLFGVDDDMNVRYILLTEAAHKYLRWLNKLYLSGLLDEAALLQSKDKLTQKVLDDNVLAIPAESWDIITINTELRNSGSSNLCYAPFPLTFSRDIESKAAVYDSLGSWKSVVTDNCRDSQKAFEFFDKMWSEEMQILCNWGIEGVHYEVVDNVRVPDEKIYSTRLSDPFWSYETELMLYNFWSYGENVTGSDGQYIVPIGNKEYIIESQDEETKKVLDAYNVEIFRDLCPPPEPSKWTFAWKLVLPSNSEGALAEQKIDTLRRKLVPQIILSNNEQEFEMYWAQFLEQAEDTGIHSREQEIYKALLEWMNMG